MKTSTAGTPVDVRAMFEKLLRGDARTDEDTKALRAAVAADPAAVRAALAVAYKAIFPITAQANELFSVTCDAPPALQPVWARDYAPRVTPYDDLSREIGAMERERR